MDEMNNVESGVSVVRVMALLREEQENDRGSNDKR